MSRRGRTSNDVCGDCGASDPSWASINRGILLCAECCSVHRSFGRHISQIKSLHQGSWSPSLLTMVQAMGTHGVNSIWEHLLLDPSSKNIRVKKPQPKDSLHPTKAEFIRAKHMQLAYILRPSQDDSQCIENDLSKQLHASVRSPNLETSVRLLVQGADPNYLHEEKGTTPLHAAVKSGQINQIELLIVYGADPNSLDVSGISPIDLALSIGQKQIARRLVECSYEVTDRMIFFLCKKRPDHNRGQHWIGSDQLSEIRSVDHGNRNARSRLQLLPNHLFEELVKDLYDEIDRRENEAIWQTSVYGSDKYSVPFLPVNPQLSTTRNQGRQKLARFSQNELAALVFDVLTDARRRQHDSCTLQDYEATQMGPSSLSSQFQIERATRISSQVSDDEPLYDSVASDDDYAALTTPLIANETSMTNISSSTKPILNTNTNTNSIQSSPAHSQSSNLEDTLRQELQYAQTKINQLNHIVQQLTSENCELKSRSSNISSTGNLTGNNFGSAINTVSSSDTLTNLNSTGNNFGLLQTSTTNINSSSNMNPLSNTNLSTGNNFNILQQATNNSNDMISRVIDNDNEHEPVHDDVKSSTILKLNQRPASMYETREGIKKNTGQVKLSQSQTREELLVRPSMTQSMYQYNNCTNSNNSGTQLPLSEEVTRRTDQVTKRISELWSCIQSGEKRDGYIPCAERIRVAVAELTAIFPQTISEEPIRQSLRNLNGNTGLLQSQCASLQRVLNEVAPQIGQSDYFLHEVRNSAYEIAKATKQLVTIFQENNS